MKTQRCQSLLLELQMPLLWFIEEAIGPSMTLTEPSRTRMLTITLQERRKVEEAYVQGLQKLARRPQQDGAAALGCVQKMMGAESG
jgi:hypothetical protein